MRWIGIWITYLDKAVGSYTVHVWESNHPDIPVGSLSFNVSRVGDQGRVSSGSVIDITTNEPNSAIPIAGDLTDVMGAGFISFGGVWRLWFFNVANGGGSDSFIVNVSANGSITGSYQDSKGAINFSTEVEKYPATAPASMADIAGHYQGSGYFFVSGPFELDVNSNGTVTYTDPQSCSVKSIPWDGNGDYVSNGDYRISNGKDEINFSVDKRGLWEFRIGAAKGINIYRMQAPDSTGNSATPTDGQYGLSLCQARAVDTTPPVITLADDLTVSSTDLAGLLNRTSEINQYLKAASAVDNILLPDWIDNVGVTNDAPSTFPIGTTVVTFTATDLQGNKTTSTGNITVKYLDQVLPVVTAPADTTIAATDANGISSSDLVAQAFLNAATATDNIDGTITAVAVNVPTTLPMGITSILFEATDSSGNVSGATAKLTVADLTPPVITLNGNNPQKVTQGATYSNLGATASDNVDGDVTSLIITDISMVNTSIAGSYSVTYNVQDTAGNIADTITRTVDVVAPQPFNLSLRHPTPTLNELLDVAWANDRFIAVGRAGTIVSSTDGITWVSHNSATSDDLRAVCWDGSRYIVMSGTTVVTSSDGLTWNATALTSSLGTIKSIACNGTNYVTATTAGLYTSTDAVTWNTSTPQLSSPLGVFYDTTNTKYVAFNFNTILSSIDGTNWTSSTHYLTNLQDVIWDGTQYVTVGYDGYPTWKPRISTSADLVTFTPQTNPPAMGIGISYSGTHYILVGINGEVASSADLVSWSLITGFPSPAKIMRATATNGNLTTPVHVVVGLEGEIYSSTDGATWTLRKHQLTTAELMGAAWDSTNSVAVAVGRGGVILSSSDLTTWSNQATNTTSDLLSITWGNGLFVTTGDLGQISTSPDGVTWTTQTSGTKTPLQKVIWSGGSFVTIGNGTALRSTDGINWITATTAPFTKAISLIWDGSQFMMTDGNNVYSSATGDSWTLTGSVTGSGGVSTLAWDGSQYIATSSGGGAVFTSTTGASWTYQKTSTNGYPTHLIWDATGSQYVVSKKIGPAGFYGVPPAGATTSVDGKTWSDRGAASLHLNHVVAAGNQFVMVGLNGVIMVAP